MNLNNIPAELHKLLALVEKWGIGDDGERDAKIYNASNEELMELVNSLTDADDVILDEWLSGDEASNPPFSEEYITYTSYLEAYQYARQVLKNRGQAVN